MNKTENTPENIYAQFGHLGLFFRLVDRYPRISSAILWAFSLWAVAYIFLNYRFTTYL